MRSLRTEYAPTVPRSPGSVHRDKFSSVLPTIWSDVAWRTVVQASGSGSFEFSAAFASRFLNECHDVAPLLGMVLLECTKWMDGVEKLVHVRLKHWLPDASILQRNYDHGT